MGCALILLGLCLAVADLCLLFWLGRAVGAPAMLGFVLLSSLVGGWLALYQGRRCVSQLQAELLQLRSPSQTLVEGVLILAAGLLMIFPGPASTALGVLFLIPPARRVLAGLLVRRWQRRFTRRAQAAAMGGPGGQSVHVQVCSAWPGRPGDQAAAPASGLKPVEGHEIASRPLGTTPPEGQH